MQAAQTSRTHWTSALVALAVAIGPSVASSQTASVDVVASSVNIVSSAAVSIAGLNASSLRAMPGYPLGAYSSGYRAGRVVVAYVVNTDGSVSDVEVLDASPVQVFTRSATRSVGAWLFAPREQREHRTVEFEFRAD